MIIVWVLIGRVEKNLKKGKKMKTTFIVLKNIKFFLPVPPSFNKKSFKLLFIKSHKISRGYDSVKNESSRAKNFSFI